MRVRVEMIPNTKETAQMCRMHEPYTRLLRRADESQKGRNREYLMFFTPLELFIILVTGISLLTLSDIVINVVKDILTKE